MKGKKKMKPDMNDEELGKMFNSLREKSPTNDVVEFISWAAVFLHTIWKDGVITHKDFAMLMDLVICT